MRKICRISLLLSCIYLLSLLTSNACTNFIVTKGASSTGSAYLFYCCDGEFVYNLHLKPGGNHVGE